jgi:hypothetical protein
MVFKLHADSEEQLISFSSSDVGSLIHELHNI